MVREIKTTLALDGEKKFKEAMADAAREMRVIKADLKAVSAEFSATDDAQKYYAQRTELLNQKIKQQTEIVNALDRAVKDSAAKYGKAAEETDGYRIKLSNATAELFKMRREAEDAARELEELGRDSDKIGRQIENGIGDAAEEVSESLDGMFAKVARDVNALKGNIAIQTTMDVGNMVIDGINAVTDFVNENTELNRQLSIAKHNVEKYDFSWQDALSLMYRASAITGNMDGAMEAISNLVGAGYKTEDLLASTVDALLGVFLTTGGSLSFESLAEDFRASVVSRVPTGTYSEVLEEVLEGIAIEEVEKALKGAKDSEEAIQIALSYLTRGGMQTETRTYEERNKELIEAQIKNQELAVAWAELADEITPIVTKITEAMIGVVNTLSDFVAWAKGIEWPEDLQLPENMTVGQGWNEIKAAKENGVTTLEMLNLLQLPEETEKVGIEKWAEKFLEWRKKVFDSVSDFNRNMDEKILNWFLPDAGAEELESQWAIQGEQDAQTYWDSFGAAFESSEYADVYRNAFEQLGVDTSTTEAEEAGAETGQAVVDGMESAAESADIAGQNISTALGNGIAAAAPGALQNAMDLVSQMNDVLGMVAVPWYMLPTQFQIPTPQGGGGSVPVGIDIDGQRVGEVLYDSISRAGGRAVMNTMLVK